MGRASAGRSPAPVSPHMVRREMVWGCSWATCERGRGRVFATYGTPWAGVAVFAIECQGAEAKGRPVLDSIGLGS